jgi:quercetin dioxygenase-like cupin family protein
MKINNLPFCTVDWSNIPCEEKSAQSGQAFWRTQHFGDDNNRIRVRMVEYTPGYVSDHWCVKGHVLLCLEGELHTELEDGRSFTLKPGMSYQVADNAEPHRSTAPLGAKLFIVD